MKNKISTVVLTQNEEDNIARCLNSLKWSDEILLIDNSTDQTVKRAKNLKLKQLKIIYDSKTDDFAALRNKALEMVKNEWVFFVDADEEVTDKLRNELNYRVVNSSVDGYLIPRRDYFLGRWLKYGETGKIKLLKLGRKNAGRWKRAVHEFWQIDNTGHFSNCINHYPHPTIKEFLEHIHRWSTLDAREFYQQGARSNFFKILFYPTAKFFLNYIVWRGFLDGFPGLVMALMMSFHSFLTRAKLYLLHNTSSPIYKQK